MVELITYKGKLKDIKVIDVNPKYTSQKYPKCGYTHKDNRNKSTHIFTCCYCNYTSNDDRFREMNLRQMGIEYHYNEFIKEVN